MADPEPKCELEYGSRWTVSHQRDTTLRIAATSLMQTVYIYACRDVTVLVDRKLNNIVVDACERVRLCFVAVLASVEVLRSSDTSLECSERVSSVTADKCIGLTLLLPFASLDLRLLTCLSSEVRVRWQDPDHPGRVIERAVPQQFEHTFENGGVQSRPASLFLM